MCRERQKRGKRVSFVVCLDVRFRDLMASVCVFMLLLLEEVVVVILVAFGG